MTVDEWVYEAVQAAGPEGASVRWVQRYIDERHYEELAIDTIERSLDGLTAAGRLQRSEANRWAPLERTSKEDAMKRLFGE